MTKDIISQIRDLILQGWRIRINAEHVTATTLPAAYIRIDIIDGDLNTALEKLIDSIINEII